MALIIATLASVPGLAEADTAPPPGDPGNPPTVGAASLPTVQIDGVVWSQAVIGNTVYVGRPVHHRAPGRVAGRHQPGRRARTCWPTTSAPVCCSPPGRPRPTAVVTVVALARRLAHLRRRRVHHGQRPDPAPDRRARTPPPAPSSANFNPNPDHASRDRGHRHHRLLRRPASARSGGQPRARLAARPRLRRRAAPLGAERAGGSVSALAAVPGRRRRSSSAAQFTTMNGSGNPGYGLAAVDADDRRPPAMGGQQRHPQRRRRTRRITACTPTPTSVYGTGYKFGSGGNLEGAVRMTWPAARSSGSRTATATPTASAPSGDAVYTVGHAHYCGNIPAASAQSEPVAFYRGMAFTKQATGTLRPGLPRLHQLRRPPSPSILQWYPASRRRHLHRPEPGRLGGHRQRRLRRRRRRVRPDQRHEPAGPRPVRASGLDSRGTQRSASSRTRVRPTRHVAGPRRGAVSWRANWDRDNRDAHLQGDPRRDTANPIHTVTAAAPTGTSGTSASWPRDDPGGTHELPHLRRRSHGNEPLRRGRVTVAGSGGLGRLLALRQCWPTGRCTTGVWARAQAPRRPTGRVVRTSR